MLKQDYKNAKYTNKNKLNGNGVNEAMVVKNGNVPAGLVVRNVFPMFGKEENMGEMTSEFNINSR